MYSKQYLESQLAVALGGRLAEEIIYGEDRVTTGDDLKTAEDASRTLCADFKANPTHDLRQPFSPPSIGRQPVGKPFSIKCGSSKISVIRKKSVRFVVYEHLCYILER